MRRVAIVHQAHFHGADAIVINEDRLRMIIVTVRNDLVVAQRKGAASNQPEDDRRASVDRRAQSPPFIVRRLPGERLII
jgi:hypothetical protein